MRKYDGNLIGREKEKTPAQLHSCCFTFLWDLCEKDTNISVNRPSSWNNVIDWTIQIMRNGLLKNYLILVRSATKSLSHPTDIYSALARQGYAVVSPLGFSMIHSGGFKSETIHNVLILEVSIWKSLPCFSSPFSVSPLFLTSSLLLFFSPILPHTVPFLSHFPSPTLLVTLSPGLGGSDWVVSGS